MKAGVSESFEAPEKCCLSQLVLREYCISWAPYAYSFFEKGCRKKMCTRQSRKVIVWDTINSLFLTLQLSNLLLLLSFSTRKHLSMVSRAILSNFFEEQ